ncbi:TatD family hydrolase [Candidatus Saccharibacteria bacterium]|nr:TatD family hydrolase [Candidatus Saccharibacteria bacterium]
MGYLIDTHCHLHDREFFSAEQAEEMLKRAWEKNVRRIICVGTSDEDSRKAAEFTRTHDHVYWTYGVHPENAGKVGAWLPEYNFLRDRALPIAIGEVGLDYHYEGYDRAAQIRLFEQMLQLAVDNDLPVSFHIREAFDDFFPVVGNFSGLRGVVHSFSDNKKNLRRILETTDFYVGVNGMATYSTLPTPPLSRILLETDAPFLTPKPFRGIINEPGYIPEIARWLSNKLGLDYQIIEEETTKNAERLFKFPDTVLCEE